MVALFSGSMVALQSRINGRLAEQVGSFPAAGFNFLSGLAMLSLLLLSARFRAGLAAVPAAIRAGGLRWFHVLGGMGGALLVSTQTYAVPLVGVAAFLVAVVGGQVVSSLVVDRQGWGPAPALGLSPLRVLAATLAVVGVALTATSGGGSGSGAANGSLLQTAVPVAVAFAVGLVGSVQYAFNGRVTVAAGSPMVTALVNFTVGAVAVTLIGSLAAAGGAVGWPGRPEGPWWSWTGGLCGILFITGAAWAVQHTGVLVFGLLAVTSQVGVGVALDLTNPAVSDRITVQVVAGVTLAVSGSALAGFAAARSARRRRVSATAAG
ncbi:MAG: DMT family transporter [Ornithinimicrobium sp.]